MPYLKKYTADCGSQITEAHWFRNIARQLLDKDKTLLTEKDKAMRIFAAREMLTAALNATDEGNALLLNEAEAAPTMPPGERIETASLSKDTPSKAATFVARAAAPALRLQGWKV